MFMFPVAGGHAPWTRGAIPPIGVLSYGHYRLAAGSGVDQPPPAGWAGVDSHGVFAEITGNWRQDSTTKAVAEHRCGPMSASHERPHGRRPRKRKPASGREVI